MVYDRGEYISESCSCDTRYWGDGICDQECDILECFYDYGDCGCNSDCFIYLGDGTCHTECNTIPCHNDGEDCQPGQEGESLPSTDSSSSGMSVSITFIAGMTIGGVIFLLFVM